MIPRRPFPWLLTCLAALAFVTPAAVRGDDEADAGPAKADREALAKDTDPDSERLIELSVQYGRLQRLRAALAAGERVGMHDYKVAVGKGRIGPQERLAAEKEALIALQARLEALRGEAKARARPQVAPVDEAAREPKGPQPLSVVEALQVMGPAPVQPNREVLGDLLLEAGEPELALTKYQQIPLRERGPWVWFSMGTCYEQLGQLKRAESTYVKVARIAHGTPLGRHALWVARTYLPQLEEALTR